MTVRSPSSTLRLFSRKKKKGILSIKREHPAATMLMWLDEVDWSRGKASPGLLLLLSRGSGWDRAQPGAGAVSIPGRGPRPRSPRAARCRSCTARWGAGGCWSSPRRTWCRRSGEKAKSHWGTPRGSPAPGERGGGGGEPHLLAVLADDAGGAARPQLLPAEDAAVHPVPQHAAAHVLQAGHQAPGGRGQGTTRLSPRPHDCLGPGTASQQRGAKAPMGGTHPRGPAGISHPPL